jgi:hypothetical protein
MTEEGRVKEDVKRLLKRYNAYYFMPVQQGYGAPGLDFHGSCRGRAFAVETKAPGKSLTPRQEITKRDMEAGGMKVFVVGERSWTTGGNNRGAVVYSGETELEAWLLGLLS